MNLFVILLAILPSVSVIYSSPSDFDCPMRELLLEYAVEINPNISKQQLQDIADALNGDPIAILYNCHVQVPTYLLSKLKNDTNNINKHEISSNTIYVSDLYGNDDINNGFGLNINHPLKTIQKAIEYSRILYGPHEFKQILIRNGTYYIKETIYFTEMDSNLLIKSYQDEYVNISGAIPLNNLQWKYYGTSRINNNKIYSAKITNNSIDNVYGLRINGFRGIRARYPNIISQETFPPEQYSLTPVKYYLKSGSDYSMYSVDSPKEFVRHNTNPAAFTNYQLEINGSYFNKFIPAASAPRLGMFCFDRWRFRLWFI